jgi:hypothetical protein
VKRLTNEAWDNETDKVRDAILAEATELRTARKVEEKLDFEATPESYAT